MKTRCYECRVTYTMTDYRKIKCSKVFSSSDIEGLISQITRFTNDKNFVDVSVGDLYEITEKKLQFPEHVLDAWTR